MEPIETRVNRGAALLDEKVPGWWERVDLEELNLSSCIRCVLGQLFSHFELGVDELATDKALEWTIANGFDKDPFQTVEYELLTSAWKHLIQQRRQKVSPAKVWEKTGRRTTHAKAGTRTTAATSGIQLCREDGRGS